jgi:NAD(P)-dependent dehydrogenase (short-subunit alcohol dehydrogenase family)
VSTIVTALTDKRILVAGGTGNVGRHLVGAVLDAEGTAIVVSRSAEKLAALVQGCDGAHGGRLVPLLGDIADEHQASAMLERAGPLHGAVASLGRFVATPSTGLLASSSAELQRAFEGYVAAHLAAAQAVIPALEPHGGGYITIQGPLAFEPLFTTTGLVSVATAAQAMLARILMQELAEGPVRVNEVVIYTSLGWGDDDQGAVTGADIGRYVTHLLSDAGAGVRGRRIHLMSPAQVADLPSLSGDTGQRDVLARG